MSEVIDKVNDLDIDSHILERLKLCFNDLSTLNICMSDTMPKSASLLSFLANEFVDILSDLCGDFKDA